MAPDVAVGDGGVPSDGSDAQGNAGDDDGAAFIEAGADTADGVTAETSTPVTFDLGSDFSVTSNPNGVWRYGYTKANTLALSEVVLDPVTADGGVVTFWQTGTTPAAHWPYVTANPGTSPVIFEASWEARPDEAALEASNSGQYSIVEFVAPATATYHVQADFAGIHARLSSTDVHVLHGDLSLFDAAINGYGGDPTFHAITGTSPNASYSGDLALHQNDVLVFALGYGADLTNVNDTTGLTLHIVEQP